MTVTYKAYMYANLDPDSKVNLWCELKLPENSSSDSGNISLPAGKKKRGTMHS